MLLIFFNCVELNFIALEIHLATVYTGTSSTTCFIEVLEGATWLPLQDETCCITVDNYYVDVRSSISLQTKTIEQSGTVIEKIRKLKYLHNKQDYGKTKKTGWTRAQQSDLLWADNEDLDNFSK